MKISQTERQNRKVSGEEENEKNPKSEKAKCEERGESCIRQHLSDGAFQCGDAG